MRVITFCIPCNSRSVVPQSIALVAEIQAAAFHGFAHPSRRQGGCCFRKQRTYSRRGSLSKLRCLILRSSACRSSSQRIARRSMRLATIVRYGSIAEVTSVASSSVKPSSASFAFPSHGFAFPLDASSGSTIVVPTPFVRSIVPLAPLVRSLAATVLAASERTVKIRSIRVPRVRQEANGTVAAVDRTDCQIRMIAQDRIERDLILTDKRADTIVLMPIRAKRKEFPGGYDKNARFSVKMLIVLDTPSSYELDAHASRSRARFFMDQRKKVIDSLTQQLRSSAIT